MFRASFMLAFLVLNVGGAVFSFRRRHPQWAGQSLQAVGGALNVAVLAANGWRMPVIGTCFGSCGDGLHIPFAPGSRLPLLCDRFIGGSSLGDWFLVLGLVAILGGSLWERVERRVKHA